MFALKCYGFNKLLGIASVFFQLAGNIVNILIND